MELDQIVAPLNIHIVAVVLGILMLAAWQIGRRMGRRLRARTLLSRRSLTTPALGCLPRPLPAEIVFLLCTCAIVTALLIGREQAATG
jgi:hypothetical protein